MIINRINSVKNKTIKELIKIKKEPEQYFFIEGYKFIKTAIYFNKINTLFFIDKYLNEFKDFGCKKYLISKEIANKICDTKTNQGIFALCEKKDSSIDLNNNVLVLDNIQDPGNLGTIIRCAKAFNFKTIVCSKECVSFYNQKVIRSTQSYLFNLNLITDELEKMLINLKQNKYLIIGSQCSLKNTFNIKSINKRKIALVLGNEGNGISSNLEKYFDENFLIKLDNSVDSLNVAVAGAIFMNKIYECSGG